MSLGNTFNLIRGALGGRREAHLDLLERIRPRIVLWCAGRMSRSLRTKVDPEDVAQEVLLAIHEALPRFEGEGERAFFGWVFRIAQNRIRDLVDYHGALKRQPQERRARTQTSPSQAVVRREASDRLRRAMDELPGDYCLVITLRRIEERSVAEAAEAMGRTVDATRVLYWRAMKALRRVLDRQARERVTPERGSRSDG